MDRVVPLPIFFLFRASDSVAKFLKVMEQSTIVVFAK